MMLPSARGLGQWIQASLHNQREGSRKSRCVSQSTLVLEQRQSAVARIPPELCRFSYEIAAGQGNTVNRLTGGFHLFWRADPHANQLCHSSFSALDRLFNPHHQCDPHSFASHFSLASYNFCSVLPSRNSCCSTSPAMLASVGSTLMSALALASSVSAVSLQTRQYQDPNSQLLVDYPSCSFYKCIVDWTAGEKTYINWSNAPTGDVQLDLMMNDNNDVAFPIANTTSPSASSTCDAGQGVGVEVAGKPCGRFSFIVPSEWVSDRNCEYSISARDFQSARPLIHNLPLSRRTFRLCSSLPQIRHLDRVLHRRGSCSRSCRQCQRPLLSTFAHRCH